MELFFQSCAAVLVALVLILCLGGLGKELGTLLALAACAMTALIALRFLQPVVDLLDAFRSMGSLNSEILDILLKASGIGLTSEIASQICADSGNTSLGKTIQMLGSAVILWLSIPLFTMLMELLQSILGEL